MLYSKEVLFRGLHGKDTSKVWLVDEKQHLVQFDGRPVPTEEQIEKCFFAYI